MKSHLRRYAAVAVLAAVGWGANVTLGAADAPAKATAKVAKPDKKAEKYQSMDYGPFLSASYMSWPNPNFDAETGNFDCDSTARGIAIKLADGFNAGVIFDCDTLRVSAGWVGGPLKFRGLIGDGAHGFDPSPSFPPTFQTPSAPGWADSQGSFVDPRENSIAPLPRPGHLPTEWAKYRGLYRHGEQVVLSYTVGASNVLESESLETSGEIKAIVRTIRIEGSSTPLGIMLADGNPQVPAIKPAKGKPAPAVQAAPTITGAVDGLTATLNNLHVAVVGAPAGSKLEINEKDQLALRLPALAAPTTIKVLIAAGGEASKGEFLALAKASPAAVDLTTLTHGGPSLWKATVETKGVISQAKDAYVVDNLTVPYENPYHSWMRVAALDFFKDGQRAAVSTWSGDVWIVSGIDANLEHLVWKRFATGLHQPLGLKIVDDKIYVVGHDQITRLNDLDSDGEADFYECFNNDWELTSAFHAFCFDLQTDPQGNFFFAFGSPVRNGGRSFQKITKDHGCILKISKDGSKMEHYATGLRAPNGMCVGPDGQVTIGDNQGTYVPADPLHWVKQGDFLGVADSAHGAKVEQPKPLCWFIYPSWDNSNGGQVWDTTDKWGPFQNELIYCSYGQSALFKVLKEEVNGVVQGGVVKFANCKFTSSCMRPRFNPADGQLYITGLQGWQTNAGREGGFDRVRFTGAPVYMPTALHTSKKGIRITFTTPLDKSIAQDPENYGIKAFNIKWQNQYGSEEYSPLPGGLDKPGHKNGDEAHRLALTVKSATLLPDGKSVMLEVPDLIPANSITVNYNIVAADKTVMKSAIGMTIHVLGDE